MYTWVEYVSAVVIAGFIALVLFTVQSRSQEAAIDSTQYRVAKTSVFDLIHAIERDLKNMGAQHPGAGVTSIHPLPGGVDFALQNPPDTSSTPHTFEFYAQYDRGAAPQAIRYEWTQDGTVTLADGSTKPTYLVKRFVDGTLDGQSFDTITRFNVWLLEKDGNAITNVEKTRQVYAEIRSVSPLGKGDTVEETRWSSVFRPLGLTIEH